MFLYPMTENRAFFFAIHENGEKNTKCFAAYILLYKETGYVEYILINCIILYLQKILKALVSLINFLAFRDILFLNHATDPEILIWM